MKTARAWTLSLLLAALSAGATASHGQTPPPKAAPPLTCPSTVPVGWGFASDWQAVAQQQIVLTTALLRSGRFTCHYGPVGYYNRNVRGTCQARDASEWRADGDDLVCAPKAAGSCAVTCG